MLPPVPGESRIVEQGGLQISYRFDGTDWKALLARPLEDPYDHNRKIRCYESRCAAYRQLIRYSWINRESWEDAGAFHTRSLMRPPSYVRR